MNNWFQKYGLLLLLVVIIAGGIIWIIMQNKNNVAFDFAVNDSPSSILDLLNGKYAEIKNNPNEKGAGIYIDVPLTTTINNGNNSLLDVRNMLGSISYNNDVVIQTKSDSSVFKNIQVTAKTSKPITDSVQLLVNPSTIKLFSDLIQGNNPKVDYNINATILGKPKTFSSSTSITQSK